MSEIGAEAAYTGAACTAGTTDAPVAAFALGTFALATMTTVALATAAMTAGADQGQDGTGREQLHVLAVHFSKVQCAGHKILL
ncbi:MAG: hypothetical protein ACRDQI_01220 [Pseudonocardiaceae bacterium]